MNAYIHLDTAQGRLRGVDSGGVVSFLGVPYGADTGGANRFRPPQPVEPWAGTRDAVVFGPSAPQVDTRVGSSDQGAAALAALYPRAGSPVEGGPMDEDCLRVNVWAPSGAEPGSLPVIVWLHGGAFTHGSGNEMVFNGDRLVRHGRGAVIVTVTHRLGIFGHLDLRDHGVPGSANAGMLDIVAALRWVRDNIRGVGGDPARVTIAGQSGGCAKVAILNAMPAARGLFRRSVLMSCPVRRVLEPWSSRAQAALAMQRLGADSIDKLRELPMGSLLDEQARVLRHAARRFGTYPLDHIGGFAPVLDDTDLPAHPLDPVAEGFRDSEVLLGWTDHDASLLLVDEPEFTTALTRDAAVALIEEDVPRRGAERYDELAIEHPSEPPHLLWAREVTDRIMRDPIIAIADDVAKAAAAVWAYRFEQTTDLLGGLLGSSHSLELAYVFGTWRRIPFTGGGPGRAELSDAMMSAWVDFAHDGHPGGRDGDWRPWAASRTAHRFRPRDLL